MGFDAWLIEQGLTSTKHITGHIGDGFYMGQITQPTVSNTEGSSGPRDQA